MYSSDDSSSDFFEIQFHNSPSPIKRKHDEEVVSKTETRVTRRKILKPMFLSPSSSSTKMVWTRNDELIILVGIVDYEIEKELSYQDDWDALYNFIKGTIELKFTRQQLKDKIRGLKKRFNDNMAKSEDGRGVSFVSNEDDEVFKLSMIIWGVKKEEEFGFNEGLEQEKDVPYVEEHEKVNEGVEQAKDVPYEQVTESVDQAEVDASSERVNEYLGQTKVDKDAPNAVPKGADESMDQGKVDVSCAEQEPLSNISMEIDDGEKEKKTEENGGDEFGVLQDAFEAISFPVLGKTHQKMLLDNLKNLQADTGKELSDEWKALVAEEMQLHIKKLAFSTKLANAIVSA